MNRIGLLTLGLLISSGCGGAPDDQPEVGEVVGIVTLDGEPLADAKIFFHPDDGGRSSTAVSGPEGKYELTYMGDAKGAKVGPHHVSVSTYQEPEGDQDTGTQTGGREELIPPKYNTDSELAVTVNEGKNEIPLELTSK